MQRLAYLRFGRVRHIIEQRLSREDHPGGTEAALQRVPLMERLLKGRQTRGISQTFDRRDGMTVGLHCQHRAGLDRSTVQPHGARTTLRRVATDVRSSKASLLAQKVNQQQ